MNRVRFAIPALRTVLVLAVSLITLIIIVTFISFNTRQFRQEALTHLHHYAATVTRDIASAVSDYIITENYASLQDTIFSFRRRAHILAITVAGPDGIVIADTRPERLGGHLDRIDRLRTGNEPQILGIDFNRWQVDNVQPIRIGDAVIGYCRVVLDISYIHDGIDTIQQKSLAFGVLVLLVLWALVIGFSLFITRPIEEMIKVAARVGRGDFEQQVEVKGVREIRLLAETFNLMTGAIREREARLRNILDSIPDAVFHADRNKRVLWANKTVRNRHGVSLGEPCYKVLWGRKTECESCCCQDALTSKQRVLTTCQISCGPEGSDLYLDIAAVPLSDSLGRSGGFVVIARDITEMVKADRERAELEAQLRHAQKMEAMGELSASIAHEFGNPLLGVRFLLRHLQDNADLAGEDQSLLAVGLDEVERMQALIRDLKSFYQPSSGQRIPTDIHHRIDNILLFHQNYFKIHRVTVEKRYADSLPEVMVVQDQITQVFINLLVNAVEAVPQEGGTVTITTACHGDTVSIAFHDTGVGISAKDQKKIFKPFFSTKPDVEGTGLGLSVSYGIVRSHGGDLRVSSSPGEGTTFTVILPLGDDTDPSSPA
ncbi:MAG TPA: HAMP domain-containing protein [Desulfobulbus sp.]|nr:HAMP domain-containing protein [Desulfobulbus sp.]